MQYKKVSGVAQTILFFVIVCKQAKWSQAKVGEQKSSTLYTVFPEEIQEALFIVYANP